MELDEFRTLMVRQRKRVLNAIRNGLPLAESDVPYADLLANKYQFGRALRLVQHPMPLPSDLSLRDQLTSSRISGVEVGTSGHVLIPVDVLA
jgi:hypothetical protein